jgi:hypothetical protein
MIEKSDWSLSQQTISAPKAALKVQHNLGDFSNSNISLGIQMKPKMKDIVDIAALEADGRKLQRYVNIHGMFEKYKDQVYEELDPAINKDINSWKLYENNQTINAHGMMEFKIPLGDAAIKGSEENINEVDQVLSTYQLRFNQTNFESDAYEICVNNTLMECSGYLMKEGEVISMMKDNLLANKSKDTFENIKKIDQILKTGTTDEKKTLYHQFYMETIPLVME